MAIYRYKDAEPKIGEGCWIAESAQVIGKVTLGKGCYVGPGAVLRGDYGEIKIGDYTSVEENVVMHARPGEVCSVGDWVTIGHTAIVHTAKSVEEGAVIGMGSIVSDYAVVGAWAAVGEGAPVKSRQEIPPRAIAVGVPAVVKGSTSDEWVEMWKGLKKKYVELAATYAKDLVRLD